MLKKSIVFLKRLPENVHSVMKIGIRHNCNIPALIMNNGNEMPMLGLGTWSPTSNYAVIEKIEGKKPEINCDELIKAREKMAKIVDMALDAGYRHIDCAHLYNNQVEIGQVINKRISEGKIKREDLFITSKLWNTFHDPSLVCEGLMQILNEFCFDYLDMFLMHSPMGYKASADLFPSNPIFSDVDYVDTWKAMEELVDMGLCKNIGISNFNKKQVEALLKRAKIRPQTLQIELHPYLTESDFVDFIKCNDITITAFAPLGSNNRPWAGNERVLLDDDKVKQLAEKHKRSPAQILLRFQIQNGNAAVVSGIEKCQIEENINIFNFELSPEDMLNLNSLNHNFRYFKFSGSYGHPHHPYEKK